MVNSKMNFMLLLGILFAISDDGVGIPENINFDETDTLGLKLVNSLVKQLEGTIELVKYNGTEFKILFKELKYKERL
jgi:two-component sensor histidine kinase